MAFGTLTPSLAETAGDRTLNLREWVGFLVTGLVEEGDRERLEVSCCSWDGGPLAQGLVFELEGFSVATEEGLRIAVERVSVACEFKGDGGRVHVSK